MQLLSKFFFKSIIWKDPKVNNEENVKLLNKTKSKFKREKYLEFKIIIQHLI
jgi:hypothetical protein